MILILSVSDDPHVYPVAQKLRERGVDFVVLGHTQFPSQSTISLEFSKDRKFMCRLSSGGESINLDSLRAVWYRRPLRPISHDDICCNPLKAPIENECEAFLHDVWNSLDCLWLPAHHSVMQRAQFKASQLKMAGALGFELPPTLVTNSPKDFLEFYRRHNGNIISKLAAKALGLGICRYTEVVSKRDVGYAEAVRYCPLIFQAYVPKCFELRITVVGRKVFAAEIHSQERNRTRYDWRRYDELKTKYLPHELPNDVTRRCVQLVESLGLRYGAIDMVFTPDGRYVFLEINPNGQYLWIERQTGLPISDAICNLLMSGSLTRQQLQHTSECHEGGPR